MGRGPQDRREDAQMDIFTGADLRRQSLQRLSQVFGKAGRLFYDFARGIDNRPVVTERIRKSVGCEETFLEDIEDEPRLHKELEKLAATLCQRVSRSNFEGYTLTLKAKFADFTQVTRSITFESAITQENLMLEQGKLLLRQVDYDHEHPIRLLGLSVSNPALTDGSHYGEWVQLEIDFQWDDQEKAF